MENDFKMMRKAVAILNKKGCFVPDNFAIFTLCHCLLKKATQPFYSALKKNMTCVKCSTDNDQKKVSAIVVL